MSLNLDARQRAMLLEMGIHVWQPAASAAAPVPDDGATAATGAAPALAQETAGDRALPAPGVAAAPVAPLAARSVIASLPATPQAARLAIEPALAPRPPAPGPAGAPVVPLAQPASADVPAGHAPAGWHLGQAQRLYADTAQAGGARWLVLAQTPAAVLQKPVFDGDAGQLLDNMLRAARLERAAAVLLAPLVRHGAAAPTPQWLAALADLVAQTRPDVVLVMGRLAALALLPSGEPFGKLRGRVHELCGARAVVTYDAPYLLRTPDDKAKAWADLCLAMSLAKASGSGL